jgi:EVE domain
MQVCHGKAGPLRRIAAGDRVVYYSPTVTFGGKDRLQAFTAMGIVDDREPYQADMGNGFCPFRRDVRWLDGEEAPIKTMLDALEFTSGKSNWGYQFRFGLFSISAADMDRIAAAMRRSYHPKN